MRPALKLTFNIRIQYGTIQYLTHHKYRGTVVHNNASELTVINNVVDVATGNPISAKNRSLLHIEIRDSKVLDEVILPS